MIISFSFFFLYTLLTLKVVAIYYVTCILTNKVFDWFDLIDWSWSKPAHMSTVPWTETYCIIVFVAQKEKQLRKGVREVQKFVRKGEKG